MMNPLLFGDLGIKWGCEMGTNICLNYDAKTISIEDEKNAVIEISVKKQLCGGKVIFKNGASLYIGLMEVLLNEMYPFKRGQTLSFERFPSNESPSTERLSKFVSDLNCVLPDFLKIRGTSSLSFNSTINNRAIYVSVIAQKKASIEDRTRFGDRLISVDWESKNLKIQEDHSSKHDFTKQGPHESKSSWNFETLNAAMSDYKREDFDEKLLIPISPYGVNLYDYIIRTFVPHSDHKICIVEGEGGAGKTTSIKYSADRLSANGHTAVIVYANQLQILEQSICSYIADKYISDYRNTRRETVIDLIREASHKNRVFIFIDGVDELPSKYYKELIGDDIGALSSVITDNLYFIISTRQRKAFIEQCDLDGKVIAAFAGRVDLDSLDLNDCYKELLVNYPQFRTPLFISMIKSIMNMSKSSYEAVLSHYGHSKAVRIMNKTQLFDTWMELRTSHAAELGVKPYYYTHLLTLTAYESLKKYIVNGDRTIPRKFFDIDNISQLLEKLGGKTRNSIDVGFSSEKLIKVFLGTGLLVTNDNEVYMFSNMEYLLYLAGFFVSLLFVHETKSHRLSRIEFLTGISIEKTNPNLALVSYPEFAFNRIMDAVRNNKCQIDDDQRQALLSLGLAIGYEKVRDVDENLQVLMNWFMKNCCIDPESARMAWRFNGPLYNMITKWRTNPENAENQLKYIWKSYDWLSVYLARFEDMNNDEWSLPIDYRANILGNKGAVEQEYAKYYYRVKEEGKTPDSQKIETHLIKALNYHNEAYTLRKTLVSQKECCPSVIMTGIARNIISISTDLYYMASYIESLDIDSRTELLRIGMFGGQGPNGIDIPGYKDALSLQGTFNTETLSWERNWDIELRECEPCLIFRRMAGNCECLYYLIKDKRNKTHVINPLFRFLMLAADDLKMSCQDDQGFSESRLEFFRPEINAFVLDINKKFLCVIKEQRENSMIEDVMDKIEMVLKIYNELHHTTVKLHRQRFKLRNY